MRGRALLLVALGAFAATTPSCLSPTLPLPPPTVDAAVDGTRNLWGVSGQCLTSAWVQVLNSNTTPEQGVVVQCSAAGTYHVGIGGKLCDLLLIQQTLVPDVSTETRFVLEPYTNGAPVSVTACP